MRFTLHQYNSVLDRFYLCWTEWHFYTTWVDIILIRPHSVYQPTYQGNRFPCNISNREDDTTFELWNIRTFEPSNPRAFEASSLRTLDDDDDIDGGCGGGNDDDDNDDNDDDDHFV